MHISMHGAAGRPGGLPRETISRPSGNADGDFASLIEAQAGNPGAGKSAIAPPVGGVNAGNGGEISTPAGGTEITAPVGKPIPPNGISTMIGNFAGDVSMLADMVPVTEVGTADDAIEAQSVDPKAPPMGSEPGGDALAIEAMRNAATLFSPLNSLLLLNEI